MKTHPPQFVHRTALAHAVWILVLFLGRIATPALAGGGPENVLLVVNSADIGSKTIANYYVQLRKIPPGNVIYLDSKNWNGSNARIDINTFREKILLPILQQIKSRSLDLQSDCIIYSSGFPWAIDFTDDLPTALRNSQSFQHPEASLSGLTYLLFPVLQKQAVEYTSFSSNNYMRLRDKYNGTVYEIPTISDGNSKGLILPSPDRGPKPIATPLDESSIGSHGFRSWYGWTEKGDLDEAGGSRYVLSAVLGVTFGRGNSVGEIIRYLQRSAPADGTFPNGTVYFMDNPDIRSQTRRPGFQLAVELLRRLGVKAEIMSGTLPQNRPDVQGLMTGAAEINWPASGSSIGPGAICENFTSYGAVFDPNAGQTPLSVFLQNGAAGSSGTVTEPFAWQNKFPHPMLQVHYARGCSLAEAFYQSVYAPYQLLIVGDPLCQPWANIPQVQTADITAGDTLSGTVTIHPTAKLPRAAAGAVDRFELFLDGVRLDTTNAEEPFELDTTKSSDGFHELRIVGIENSAIESQGRIILPVQFNNYGKTIQFYTSPEQRVRAGGAIKVFAKAPGMRGVAFYHYDQANPVAKFVGPDGEATIDTDVLGDGPVTLQAVGWGEGGFETHVYSKPITLTVEGNGIRAEPANTPKKLGRKEKFEQQPSKSRMHEHFMRLALAEAEAALAENEVPIGALIVHGERVIAAAHNQREQLRDPTAHAEMIAITQAAQALGDWRLEGCALYVTLEPCPMCAGAIVQARVPLLVYGAADPKAGAVATLFQLLTDRRLNHQAQIVPGVLADQCGNLLTRFFQAQRKLGKK